MLQEAHADHPTATYTTILQFHEAFNRHDIPAIMALMTDDCIFENTYPPPDGERYEGQAAVRDFWEALFRASPNAHFTVEDVFATQDRGVIRWIYHWGDAEGDRGHVRGVDIFRVRDRKIAEKCSYVKG